MTGAPPVAAAKRKLTTFIAPAVITLFTIGVVIYLVATTGQFSGASAALSFGAFAMALSLWLMLRAAQQLLVEAVADPERMLSARRKKELEREKYFLLKALKELEFDHEMGKVALNDFKEIGGQYRARALRVLRQLDENSDDYAVLLERELRARRQARGGANKELSPDIELDKREAERIVSEPAVAVVPACPSCETRNDLDAAFCKKCGHKLASGA